MRHGSEISSSVLAIGFLFSKDKLTPFHLDLDLLNYQAVAIQL